jgi:hypothetical protein
MQRSQPLFFPLLRGLLLTSTRAAFFLLRPVRVCANARHAFPRGPPSVLFPFLDQTLNLVPDPIRKGRLGHRHRRRGRVKPPREASDAARRRAEVRQSTGDASTRKRDGRARRARRQAWENTADLGREDWLARLRVRRERPRGTRTASTSERAPGEDYRDRLRACAKRRCGDAQGRTSRFKTDRAWSVDAWRAMRRTREREGCELVRDAWSKKL